MRKFLYRAKQSNGFTPSDSGAFRVGNHRSLTGFTLMEVVVASFVVTVAMVALLSAFLSGLLLVESGRNMAMATADARAVFEEMRRLSGSGLASVTSRNWTNWSRDARLRSLPDERIDVTFRNRFADPLEATVVVNWTERNNRRRSARFTGLVTRR